MDIDPKTLTLGSYKGTALVVLGGDRKFPFQFGAGKAQLILDAIDAMGAEEFAGFLRDFVRDNAKEAR